jgi:C4-dicarboxylate-specific signal transduction histidine kinase
MDHMSVGEVIAAIMAALFALAFAAWAKRLDKALDLLEKIQAAMNRQAIRIERRLTILEQIAASCGHRARFTDDDGEEE